MSNGSSQHNESKHPVFPFWVNRSRYYFKDYGQEGKGVSGQLAQLEKW